ncbi:competence pheromone ComX [Gracilibacillus caseinilyticus]|uniref:ComX pheromone n=1 Tax=Gracilibacillus caseinilyticus TaxID=2932256 RepID=A0ABY4EZ53_9BACI|nr:competence pheromone ComX [Gracilibacillus caseinilyticus]UOQ49127.1 competence pheromone ComX [Gracilibacillus caseinilyticus]
MLQNVVEKLVKNPDLIKRLKEGKLELSGVSEMEKAAVLDVVSDNNSTQQLQAKNCYWQ